MRRAEQSLPPRKLGGLAKPTRGQAGGLRLAGLVMAAVVASSCGARSNLEPGELAIDIAPNVPCIKGRFTLRQAHPTLLFVIDRSRSMLTGFGDSNASRWAVLASSLASVLPPVDQSMEIGALLFPSPGPGDNLSCSVATSPSLQPATNQVPALLSLLENNPPGGSTPTADAIAAAAQSLQGLRAAGSAKALVLATDGAPDCNAELDPSTCVCLASNGDCPVNRCLDDTRTVSRIAAAAASGIPTYVIGLASGAMTSLGALLDASLDAMADAGQRPQAGQAHRYYAASSEVELSRALTTIRDRLGSCTYLTSSVPDAEGTIRVSLAGRQLAFDPTGQVGWSWADRANGEIVFSPAACAEVSASGAPVTADLFCS